MAAASDQVSVKQPSSLETTATATEGAVSAQPAGAAMDMNAVSSYLESMDNGTLSAALGSEAETIYTKAANLVKELRSKPAPPPKIPIDRSVVKKEAVEVIVRPMRELEVDKTKAEQSLSASGGDVQKALLSLMA
ncbi:hypothetical protein HDU91_003573 [Kappamyces sp. JEL0680]|nr:hypothetical protein HDU91_003573 [Kappamyces sp. JEL0680]